MSKQVSITVPHSYCISTKVHTCDFTALLAASHIFNIFRLSDILTKIYIADKNRTITDYNRIESRYTQWRQVITQDLKNYNIKLALDIHSFPDDTSSFGYFNNTKELPELVILDSYHENKKYLDEITSINLNNFLLQKNIRSKLLFGGDNDIMISARKNKTRCILLEFNESLDNSRLVYITHMLVKYFLDYLD